jgi:thiamine biosynthesis protein ThiI
MQEIYLVKVGELTLKGGNRNFFEKKLKTHVKLRLQGKPNKFTGTNGRFYLRIDSEYRKDAEQVLGTTFGIVGFSRCLAVAKNMEAIEEAAREIEGEFRRHGAGRRFKVEARRADKQFPLTSYELMARLGGVLLTANPELKVDVKTPEWKLNVEIRDKAFLYGPEAKGLGGLPVGSAGRGTLLLSGGIDSPVGGYLMAKRGLRLDAVYFHAYPYTSDEAKEKVVELARRLAPYLGGINLYVVPFTEPQLRIREKGPLNEATLLMRAAMVVVADHFAREREATCLVTGESLSQVASQTTESIGYTGSATDLPIFRPLIGFDKREVIELAREIGTYETSILPYEDCCTIVSPKNPVIKPDRQALQKSYQGLDIDDFLQTAVDNTERIYIPPREGILPEKEYL